MDPNDDLRHKKYYLDAAIKREKEKAAMSNISDTTRIKLTIPQIWGIVVIVAMGVSSACITYFGITERIAAQQVSVSAEISKVNTQLAELNYLVRNTVSRDDFNGWTDDFRNINPTLRVPTLLRRQSN